MSTETRTIVVAIPVRNEAANIENLLRSLDAQRVDLPNMHIVVVDGGSTDATVAIAQRVATELPMIDVEQNPKKISGAMNLIARRWAGRADIMVRCDAHCGYPENYVATLVNRLVEMNAASVVVPMDSVGSNCFGRAVGWVSDTSIGNGGSRHRGGQRSGFVDHGHHAAFDLDRFVAAGGYDETFTHNEDAEFDCRVRANGGKIYLDATARITYYPRDTFKSLWRQYWLYGKGRSRTVRRHPGSMRLRQFAVPAHVVLLWLSVLLAAITAQPLFLAWPAIYLALLVAASVKVAADNRSVCGLFAGVAAFAMHMAWGHGFLTGLLLLKQIKWTPTGADAPSLMH